MKSDLIIRLAALTMVCCALLLIAGMDPATKDALKVQHILKTIERHSSESSRGKLNAEVSEKEANAYIAYRLKQEQDTLINRFKVALLGNNNIQGRLSLDAGRLNLGILVGSDLDFDFQGTLVTQEGKGRLDLKTLQLNGRSVQPRILDLVLHAAGLYYGRELGRIDDWYELPRGIDRIFIDQGKAVLFY